MMAFQQMHLIGAYFFMFPLIGALISNRRASQHRRHIKGEAMRFIACFTAMLAGTSNRAAGTEFAFPVSIPTL
ncbi:MAG TPA: hypothetical protein VGT79_09305 [Xanthomonadaceae bacterium]|nr:hypothetical protein [Xanthomonadaceae bacterium]